MSGLLRHSRRRMEPPFYVLIQGLQNRSPGRVLLLAKVLTLINVMIQCTPQLEERNRIRNCFLAFDLLDLCEAHVVVGRQSLIGEQRQVGSQRWHCTHPKMPCGGSEVPPRLAPRGWFQRDSCFLVRTFQFQLPTLPWDLGTPRSATGVRRICAAHTGSMASTVDRARARGESNDSDSSLRRNYGWSLPRGKEQGRTGSQHDGEIHLQVSPAPSDAAARVTVGGSVGERGASGTGDISGAGKGESAPRPHGHPGRSSFTLPSLTLFCSRSPYTTTLGNPRQTKHRWYEIDMESLKWFRVEKKNPTLDRSASAPSSNRDGRHRAASAVGFRMDAPESPEGEISTDHITGISLEASDPEIIKATPYSFEITTRDRVFSLGVNTEEERVCWVTALKVMCHKPPSSFELTTRRASHGKAR